MDLYHAGRLALSIAAGDGLRVGGTAKDIVPANVDILCHEYCVINTSADSVVFESWGTVEGGAGDEL